MHGQPYTYTSYNHVDNKTNCAKHKNLWTNNKDLTFMKTQNMD